MPQVTVNVFTGIEAQIPVGYEVEGNIYQDIVTALINWGIQSGQIYGINGENIDYNAAITMNEVNYIIPEGSLEPVYIKFFDGAWRKGQEINYNENGYMRDIYNVLVAKGYPLNINLFCEGKIANLDDPVSKYNIPILNSIIVRAPRK